MQAHASNTQTSINEDSSMTGLFVGSGFSLFGFLLLIILMA